MAGLELLGVLIVMGAVSYVVYRQMKKDGDVK